MADEDKRVPLGPSGRWIATALKQRREERGMTYKDLAARLAALGRPIARQGLRRIENGERRVDMDDLLALARALEVPPVLLVFPLGRAASVEVLPGVERPTWQTVKWFTGDAAFPDERPSGRHDYLAGTHGDAQAFFSSATPVVMHREHDRRMEEVRWALGRVPIIAEALAKAASAEERAAHQARLDDARADLAQRERAVVDHRRRMREAGVVPPPLESALAHLDNGDGSRLTPALLREVAKVYRAGASDGAPTRAVAEHFQVSHRTATRWVGEARKAGELDG